MYTTEINIIIPPIHVHMSGFSENMNNPINEAQISFVNCKGITNVVSDNLNACARDQCDNNPEAPIKIKTINWFRLIFSQ